MKKSIKWFIAGILTLAVVAAALILIPVFLGSEVTPQATTPTETESTAPDYSNQIFWNIDYETYKPGTDNNHMRDGKYFRASFAVNGEQISLFFDSVELLNQVDAMQYMGFVINEENIVQEVIPVERFTAGCVASNLYVESFTDTEVTVNTVSNFRGHSMKLYADADTKYYLADPKGGPLVGMPTSLERGCQVTAIAGYDGFVDVFFVNPPFRESPVYYNLTRQYDSTLKMSTRESDILGVYTIPFSVDGKQVELKCKNRDIVNIIDGYATSIMHLIFDEDGYIIDAQGSWNATGTYSNISWCYVTEIYEDRFVALKLSGGKVTETHTGYFGDKVRIYDVSSVATLKGEPTELRVGDRVHCSCNKAGDITYIYVNQRSLDYPIYWSLGRKYDSDSKQTTRTPNSNGYYTMELAYDGKQVTLQCKDKELVTKMDSYPARCFGLDIKNGEVVGVYDPWSCVNGTTWGSWVDITSISSDGTVTADKLTDGKVTASYTGKITQNTKYYNCSTNTERFAGEETTLKVGDRVHALRDIFGNLTYCFIVNRPVDMPIYWVVDPMYDKTNKVSTRTADEDGWYHILVTINGKQETVKTKDKSLVNTIDSRTPCGTLGMQVYNGIVYKVEMPWKCKATSGGDFASWCKVTEVRSDGTIVAVKSGSGETYSTKVTKYTKVYNVSTNSEFVGEPTTIKVGDTIHGLYAPKKASVPYIYVVSRPIDYPIYWNVEPMYDKTNQVSTRVPDAEGWYHFTMAIDGGHVQLKTQDKDIVNTIDSRAVATIGLKVIDGVIVATEMPWKCAQTSGGDFGSWSYISELGQDGTIVTLKVSGGTTTRFEGKLTKDVKIYDVSSSAELEGEYGTLQIGDLIHGLAAPNKTNVPIIYIITKGTGEIHTHCVCGGSATGIHDHTCNDSVMWRPFPDNTTNLADLGSGDYYLTKDVQITGASALGNKSKVTLNIDLNGYKLTSNNTRIMGNLYSGSSVSFCDCSGKQDTSGSWSWDGAVIAGANCHEKYGANGGICYQYGGSVMNIYGGNFTSLCTKANTGSVFVVANDGVTSPTTDRSTRGTFNLYNGRIYQSVTAKNGGVIGSFHGPIINIHGGTVDASGHSITGNGGAIYLAGSIGEINITGGTVKGGNAVMGGTIYTAGGNVNITGGTITGGTASTGGNVYANDLTITGGIITDGTAVNGENIALMSGFTAKIQDCTVSNGNITVENGSNLTLGGIAKIDALYFAPDAKVSLSPMQGNAKIYVDMAIPGVFAEGTEKDLAFFDSVSESYSIVHEDGKLSLTFSGTAGDGGKLDLRYDDRKTLKSITGKSGGSVTILEETVTSKAVGTNSKDEHVIAYDADTSSIIAVGTGTAKVLIGDSIYDITVTPAPISLLMITGHSVGIGEEGDKTQSVVVEAGQAYSTHKYEAYYSDNSNRIIIDPNTVNANTGLGWGAESRLPDIDDFAPGQGGTIGEGSGLAYQWVKLTGEKVWILNAASGGTVLNEWQPGQKGHSTYFEYHYDNAVAAMKTCQTILKNEIAAGHYTFSHMAVLYHSAANFGWFPGWDDAQIKTLYAALWNNFSTEFSTDMDGDGDKETVEAMGFVPAWTASGANNRYSYDNPANHFMAASKDYPQYFIAGIYRPWVSEEGLASFPAITYTTQSSPVSRPTSVHNTAHGGTSDNSFFADTIHPNQVGYNAIGMMVANNLYTRLYGGATAASVDLIDVYGNSIAGPVTMKTGEKTTVIPVVTPVYGGGLSFEVSENLAIEYPLTIVAKEIGTGTLTVKLGSTVLKTLEFHIEKGADPHIHCICGGASIGVAGHVCENIEWTPYPNNITNFGNLPSGNYFLTKDLQISGASDIGKSAPKDIVIDLNGFTISSSGCRIMGNIYAGNRFAFTDCSGVKDSSGNWTFEGNVIAGPDVGKYGHNGGICYMYSNSQIDIYGGNFTSLCTTPGTGSLFTINTDGASDVNSVSALATLNIWNGRLYQSADVTAGGLIGTFNGGIVNIHGGKFEGGTHKVTGNGGLIYLGTKISQLTITGGHFSGGQATNGGMVYCSGSIHISGGTFMGGKSNNYGGQIHGYNSNDFQVTGGSFSGGEAGKGGGNLMSKNMTFSGATVQNGISPLGANIYTQVLTMHSGTVTDGTSSTNGGNIYSENSITIHGGTVSGGKAGSKTAGNGGNLYAQRVTLNGGTISGGAHSSGYNAFQGGNIYVTKGFTMTNGSVIEGVAYEFGGNLYVTTGASVSITGGFFQGGKTMNNSGGSMYLSSGGTISNCTIDGGNGWNGAAIYLNADVTMTLTDCTIKNAAARSRGGALYLNSGASATLNNCTITNCTAKTEGNAIYVKAGASLTVNGGSCDTDIIYAS